MSAGSMSKQMLATVAKSQPLDCCGKSDPSPFTRKNHSQAALKQLKQPCDGN